MVWDSVRELARLPCIALCAQFLHDRKLLPGLPLGLLEVQTARLAREWIAPHQDVETGVWAEPSGSA